jgi:hypothetical protein
MLISDLMRVGSISNVNGLAAVHFLSAIGVHPSQ